MPGCCLDPFRGLKAFLSIRRNEPKGWQGFLSALKKYRECRKKMLHVVH